MQYLKYFVHSMPYFNRLLTLDRVRSNLEFIAKGKTPNLLFVVNIIQNLLVFFNLTHLANSNALHLQL